jgi:hypothetical protein
MVFSYATPCCLVDGYKCLGGNCCLHLKTRKDASTTLEVWGDISSETLAATYQTTRRHIPGDRNLDTREHQTSHNPNCFCFITNWLKEYVWFISMRFNIIISNTRHCMKIELSSVFFFIKDYWVLNLFELVYFVLFGPKATFIDKF